MYSSGFLGVNLRILMFGGGLFSMLVMLVMVGCSLVMVFCGLMLLVIFVL